MAVQCLLAELPLLPEQSARRVHLPPWQLIVHICPVIIPFRGWFDWPGLTIDGADAGCLHMCI